MHTQCCRAYLMQSCIFCAIMHILRNHAYSVLSCIFSLRLCIFSAIMHIQCNHAYSVESYILSAIMHISCIPHIQCNHAYTVQSCIFGAVMHIEHELMHIQCNHAYSLQSCIVSVTIWLQMPDRNLKWSVQWCMLIPFGFSNISSVGSVAVTVGANSRILFMVSFCLMTYVLLIYLLSVCLPLVGSSHACLSVSC